METRGFRELEVYRRSVGLADEIRWEVQTWAAFDLWTVGVQMIRAADSVGANIAEACGRHGHADQRRLLFVARGSLLELQHWLERALARGLSIPTRAVSRAATAGRMLNGLIRAFS